MQKVNMLRRRGTGFGGGLPTTSNAHEDGSGKSIKMEAPLAKAIRTADGFVKGTYMWFFISIFFVWGGWSWIRRNSSSMVLDCNSGGCTLTIQTPYVFLPRNSSTGVPTKTRSRSKRRIKINLERDQIVRADNVKWNPVTQSILENYGLSSPTYTSQQQNAEEEEEETPSNQPWNEQNKKKKAKSAKKNRNPAYNRHGGPDANGNYDSYVLVLRDPLPPESVEDEGDPEESPSMKMQRRMAARRRFAERDPNSLASQLAPYLIDDGGANDLEYVIHLRDFNLGQTRRLARNSVSKIVAYTKGRRATCILRESRPVAWQGLVLLILGIFSAVLCLLIGQFWEEHDPTKVGSYRKRMAEIRKREEERKRRLSRKASVGRRPAQRRPGGRPPSQRRPEGRIGAGGRAGNSASRTSTTGSSVGRTSSSSTGTVRSRHNAGTNKSTGGDSWMGGAAHVSTKRGY